MSSSFSFPDLTARPPRSPRVKLGGYVLLPRILDKGRAASQGRLGAYRFNGKGIDRHFLAFTGIDFEALKAEIATGKGDSDMLAWLQASSTRARDPWEIEAWSRYQENRAPDSDAETLGGFLESVGKLSTQREDIKTWFDFLDLDDHCTFGGIA